MSLYEDSKDDLNDQEGYIHTYELAKQGNWIGKEGEFKIKEMNSKHIKNIMTLFSDEPLMEDTLNILTSELKRRSDEYRQKPNTKITQG